MARSVMRFSLSIYLTLWSELGELIIISNLYYFRKTLLLNIFRAAAAQWGFYMRF